jgi:hypothetical protein
VRRLGSPLITLGAGLGAAVPVIVATVNAVRDHWEPGADQGIIAARAHDVLSSHTPLDGQYSLAGEVTGQVTHCLGPMLYWLIALPARFGSPAAITITMGAVNALAVIGAVALARRRGGLVLMFATAIAIALMCRSLAAETFHDVWNPSAGLFPFLLLILLCWSVACGDHRLLPVTVLVASFVVQAHLMYLPPTAGLLAVAAMGLVMSKRGRPLALGRRALALGLATLLVAAACWIAPTIDELDHRPGNLTLVVRSATAHAQTLGATVGWHAMARAIGWMPWWLHQPADRWTRKHDVLSPAGTVRTATTIVLLAALVVAATAGALRRRGDVTAAAAIGLVMTVALAVEAAHTPVPRVLSATLAYTMWWGSQLGMWVWLVVGWCAWLVVAPAALALAGRVRLPALGARGRLTVALASSLFALGGLAAAGAIASNGEQPDEHVALYRPIAAMGARLTSMFAAGETVRLEGGLDVSPMPIKPALRYLLVRHGVRVVSRGASLRLGDHYDVDHLPYVATLYVRDRPGPPVPHTRLAARARYVDGWGPWTISVWVGPGRRATTGAPRGARTARPRGSRSRRRDSGAGTAASLRASHGRSPRGASPARSAPARSAGRRSGSPRGAAGSSSGSSRTRRASPSRSCSAARRPCSRAGGR